MPFVMLICARCADSNHPSTRFCQKCGLPLGSVTPDAKAGHDALGPYEAPEPADPDTSRLIRAIVTRWFILDSPGTTTRDARSCRWFPSALRLTTVTLATS